MGGCSEMTVLGLGSSLLVIIIIIINQVLRIIKIAVKVTSKLGVYKS